MKYLQGDRRTEVPMITFLVLMNIKIKYRILYIKNRLMKVIKRNQKSESIMKRLVPKDLKKAYLKHSKDCTIQI